MKKQLLEMILDVIILPEEEFKKLCFILLKRAKNKKEDRIIRNLIRTAKRYRK